jgi:hypothetical protein
MLIYGNGAELRWPLRRIRGAGRKADWSIEDDESSTTPIREFRGKEKPRQKRHRQYGKTGRFSGKTG